MLESHIYKDIVAKHPLPWRVERDWTFEVIASDNAIIAKFADSISAQEFIKEIEAHGKG